MKESGPLVHNLFQTNKIYKTRKHYFYYDKIVLCNANADNNKQENFQSTNLSSTCTVYSFLEFGRVSLKK